MLYFFKVCSQFHIFLDLEYVRILLADNLLGSFLCEAYEFIILRCRYCTDLDLSSRLIRILLWFYENRSHRFIICCNCKCKFLYRDFFEVGSQIYIFGYFKYIWVRLTEYVSFCIGPVHKAESFVCHCNDFCFFTFFVASVCGINGHSSHCIVICFYRYMEDFFRYFFFHKVCGQICIFCNCKCVFCLFADFFLCSGLCPVHKAESFLRFCFDCYLSSCFIGVLLWFYTHGSHFFCIRCCLQCEGLFFRLCKCKHKWSWNGFISCVVYCCNTYLINSSDFQFVHCKFCGLTVSDLHTILINIIACHVCVSRCCPCQLC